MPERQDVFRLYYRYNASGYVTEEGDSRLWDDFSITPLRTIFERNARDQVTRERYGNGLINDYSYYPATGQMQKTEAGTSGSLYSLQYEYDLFGNLSIAIDNSRSVGEQYSYDRLHRIKSNTRYVNGNPQGPVSAGPNAVTNADGRQYAYDANGNLICSNAADGSLSAQYDAFNLPLSLGRNSQSILFGYGSVRYLHRDRLNSILAITDKGGAEPQATARRFDPFGRPQEENMSAGNGLLKGANETPRGFTQHEHLNSIALIHMNGVNRFFTIKAKCRVSPALFSTTNG